METIIENQDINYPWVEEFRPTKIEHVIGAEHLISKLNEFIASKSCPHLLFAGSSGVGKTTVAKLLAEEISGEGNYIYINASDENSIDTIRTKVMNFCGAMSFDDRIKIIILDECDGMTPQAQKSLRAVIEEYSKTCRFILTCNHLNKIIDAITSRCPLFDFKNAEKIHILKKCAQILSKKGVKILTEDRKLIEPIKKDLEQLVKRFYPDIRATINNLQKFTINNEFKFDINATTDETTEIFVKYIKEGNIKAIREEILSCGNVDYTSLYTALYTRVKDITSVNEQIGSIIIVAAEYQYRHSLSINTELNFVACLLEIVKVMRN